MARRRATPTKPAAGTTKTLYRSTRAIELREGSNRVISIKVPKIGYDFLADFPYAARQKVLEKKRLAENDLELKKKGVRTFASAESLLIDFVLQVFFAFAEEALQLGLLGILTAAELDEECRSVLRNCVMEAGFVDGHLVEWAWGKSAVAESIYIRIEKSDRWKEYIRHLQEVAVAQNDGPEISSSPAAASSGADDVDTNRVEGVAISRSDWRDDAAFARENPGFLRPVKAARLHAIATLQKEAAAAVQTNLPPTKEQLEICFWPALAKYAEEVFDRLAEAELAAVGPGHQAAYSLWLRKKCLPAVIEDVCAGIFGQFPLTLRNVIETLGQRQSPEIDATRRALWGIGILGNPFTESLRNSLNAHLEGRSTHWEAIALSRKPAPAAAGAVRIDRRTLAPASDEQPTSLSDRDTAVHNLVGAQRFETLTNAEIMQDRTLKKNLLNQYNLDPGDPAKCCLDRIRRAKRYLLSGEIRKKRSSADQVTVKNGRKLSRA